MLTRRPSDVLRLLRYFNQTTSCSAHCRHGFGTNKSSSKTYDYAFEFKSSNLRFGEGVTKEVGYDLENFGAKNVLIVTDSNMVNLPPVQQALDSIVNVGNIKYDIYDKVRVEPTDNSLKDIINYCKTKNFDSFLAIGGGSTIDTAKTANLFTTHPNYELYDFVNAPVGKGLPVPGPLKPLIAIPTTTGTGSETTGVAVFDIESLGCKTGIGNRYLTPALGLVDPNHSMYQPSGVVISSGFDVLCHALESYTAISYSDRSPCPDNPNKRPAYQGANPISDVWCQVSLPMLQKYFFRAVEDPEDREARKNMQYASCYAGMGFGTAGVHLCHGMSYPISGLNHNRNYVFEDYEYLNHPIIPHGVSVVVTAPSVFDFTCSAKPERHKHAAIMLGVNENNLPSNEYNNSDNINLIGNKLKDKLLEYMQRLRIPNGLKECGFDNSDINELVKGTMPQERVTKISPYPIDEDIIGKLFENSMKY